MENNLSEPITINEEYEVIRIDLRDSEIVALFERRDERALAEVQGKYGKYCAAVAMNILKNREDADHAVNDALMRLWEKIPPAKPKNLAGFFAKTTKMICLNKYASDHTQKRGASENTLILDELAECIASGTNVERAFEEKELMEAVNAFMGTLPKKKRDMFILRYWYRMSLKDISKRLGLSENNIAVSIGRTRKKLLEYLKRRELL